MYGFCSDVLRPDPSAGTTGTVWNGLATATRMKRKNAPVPPRIAVSHGSRSWSRLRLRHTARLERPVSTSPQSSSEPACELQNDENW